MIDLHSHILPGIDDGADDLNASLEMAKQAVDSGVVNIVCTPHIHTGYFDNDKEIIATAFEKLVEAKNSANLPLKLAYSAEVRICPEIMHWIANEQIPYLGSYEDRKVMLIELPHSHIPPGTENLLRWLVKNGIQPVIAHPERNRDIIANYNKISPLKHCGCLFQVTAGSLIGRFSDPIKDISSQMLKDGIITYIASDTHDTDRRPNDMKAAYELLESVVDTETAKRLCREVPEQISRELEWH